MSDHARDVVVVGGGASGAAVAIHLMGRAGAGLRVAVVERGSSLGRGVAYGVQNRAFRLNVPASRMSLDPRRPGDFADWAAGAADAFESRARYGQYVESRFAEAMARSPGVVRVVRGDAVDVDPTGVVLADGTRLHADVIVLATGIAPRVTPSPFPDDPRIADAWHEPGLADLRHARRVLVLGAGLSALDVLALLEADGFSGAVTILSRRGLLPRPHLSTPQHLAITPPRAADVHAAPAELRPLIRWVRQAVRAYEEQGLPWQSAIDALRPHVAQLFRAMTPADRRRFVRRVRPYWDVLRHRAPSDALARVAELQRRGRLEVLAGRVARCEPTREGLDLEIVLASGLSRAMRYDRVVRCIGPALEPTEHETPLVRALVRSGLAMTDPAGLGIVTDAQGRVVDRAGVASERVLAIGAVRRASSWETTSIPDIARHALELAERIAP